MNEAETCRTLVRPKLEAAGWVDALEMAITRRRPAAGLLAHSDRGRQYAGDEHQRALAAEGSCVA